MMATIVPELWNLDRLYNEVILAACIDAGIDTLYTEDLSHGVVYDGVTVLNPFVP